MRQRARPAGLPIIFLSAGMVPQLIVSMTQINQHLDVEWVVGRGGQELFVIWNGHSLVSALMLNQSNLQISTGKQRVIFCAAIKLRQSLLRLSPLFVGGA